MADTTYTPAVYRRQGADAYVLANGGILKVESGGKIQLGETTLSSTCLYMGAGTSSAYLSTSTADSKFIELRLKNTATSGDNRGIYLRLQLAGAGSGGESLRAFTNCQDVACGTAHGAHISLSFGTSGSITGLGCGSRSTLHVPNAALSAGTYCGAMVEIWHDGASSDISGTTEHSILRLVNSGNATGQATVSNVLSIVGASATMVAEGTVGGTDKAIRILIDGVVHYLAAGTSYS